MTTEQDRYRGALLGLACADAKGGAVESSLRMAHGLLDSGSHESAAAPGDASVLTRLAPVPMYYAHDPAVAVWNAEQLTRTVDDTPEAVDCARLLAWQLCSALLGKTKDSILSAHPPGQLGPAAAALAEGAYQHKTVDQLDKGGSPLQLLEAALWCFWHTTSFKQAVLATEDLGDAAGATSAIVGQLAGAYYGVQDIPGDWLEKLAQEDELLNVADSLLTKRAQHAAKV